jgi:hypothetical protein
MVKKRVYAAMGPPGVIGDSARGKMSRGTWETQRGGGLSTNVWRENITVMGLRWESEGFIVARKRLITVEQRDPTEDMFL